MQADLPAVLRTFFVRNLANSLQRLRAPAVLCERCKTGFWERYPASNPFLLYPQEQTSPRRFAL
jgi:hypothetical protein